jgi:hypothetical protein
MSSEPSGGSSLLARKTSGCEAGAAGPTPSNVCWRTDWGRRPPLLGLIGGPDRTEGASLCSSARVSHITR